MVNSLITDIAGARARRGAISVLLFAVFGTHWLADIVLVHLIAEIALAYAWRHAFSVDTILAIRQTFVLRVFHVSLVAFAIIIRQALAIQARWGANRYANIFLKYVSLAAVDVDAVGAVILRREKFNRIDFTSFSRLENFTNEENFYLLAVIPTIFCLVENPPFTDPVRLLVRDVSRRYETTRRDSIDRFSSGKMDQFIRQHT